MKRSSSLTCVVLSFAIFACSGTSTGSGNSSGSSSSSGGTQNRELECRTGGSGNPLTETCICRRDGAFVTEVGKSPVTLSTCDTSWNRTTTGGAAACCATSDFDTSAVGYCSCAPPRKIGCGSDSASSGLCFCNSLEHKYPLSRCTPQTHGPACCKSKTIENFCTCGLACDADETQVPSCEQSVIPAKCPSGQTTVESCSE